MTVTVFQVDMDAPFFDRELWLHASMPSHSTSDLDLTKDALEVTKAALAVAKRDAAVLKLFARGAYREAATVDGDLEDAFAKTQNGGYTPSWSMLPLAGVTVVGDGYTFHDVRKARAEQMRQDEARYGEGSTNERMLEARRKSMTTDVTKDGEQFERQPFGYQSSQTGDVFRDNETGKVYVCASFGFDQVA